MPPAFVLSQDQTLKLISNHGKPWPEKSTRAVLAQSWLSNTGQPKYINQPPINSSMYANGSIRVVHSNN